MTVKNRILLSYSFVFFLMPLGYCQTYLAQIKSIKNNKWGYINQHGEIVIQPQYVSCYPFSRDGLAVVFDSNNNQYVFINTSGAKIKTDVNAYKVALEEFRDGLVTVKYSDRGGYFDKSGRVAIPAKYDEVNGFGTGHAAVTVNKKIYIIDVKGNGTPVPPGIIQVREFSEGLAPFRSSDKKFGFLDILCVQIN